MSSSMIFLDSSVLIVALPTIQRELCISTVGLQWIVNAYFLALAAFVIVGGRIGDLLGHRKLFCIGMAIFAFASAMCGFAFNEKYLIWNRAIQGIGGAIMGPASMSLLIEMYPKNKRGRVIGALTAISAIFLALGPLIGGAITEFYSWRWIFFLNLPLGACGICLALFSYQKSKKIKEKFDLYFAILLIATLAFFTVGIMMGRDWGWLSRSEVICISCGVISAFFLCRSFKYKEFGAGSAHFNGGVIIIFLAQFLSTVSIFSSVFFQKILECSPLEAGLVTAVSTLPVLFCAPLSGYLSDMFGPKIPISMGCVLIAIGLFSIYNSVYQTSVSAFIPGLVSFGAGLALIITPTGSITMSSIPIERRGVAMGVYNTSRYTGGTLGVALFGMLFTTYRDAKFMSLLRSHDLLKGIDHTTYYGILGKVQPALDQLSLIRFEERSVVKESLIAAYSDAFGLLVLCGGMISLIALGVALFSFSTSRLHKIEA